MSIAQREFRRLVIERLDLVPLRFAVTLLASLTQVALVWLDVPVTINAASGRLAECRRLGVTLAAWHGGVRVPEREVRRGMIEGFTVELDDIAVASGVLGMTMVAVLPRGVRAASMKSLV